MRSIPKAVEDYERLTKDADKILLTDIAQVWDIAREPNGKVDIWTAITTALRAGYMIGYRTARRQERARKRGNAIERQ